MTSDSAFYIKTYYQPSVMKDCRDFLDMQETKIFTHIPYVPFLQKLLFYQEEGIETGNPPQGLGTGNPE